MVSVIYIYAPLSWGHIDLDLAERKSRHIQLPCHHPTWWVKMLDFCLPWIYIKRQSKELTNYDSSDSKYIKISFRYLRETVALFQSSGLESCMWAWGICLRRMVNQCTQLALTNTLLQLFAEGNCTGFNIHNYTCIIITLLSYRWQQI